MERKIIYYFTNIIYERKLKYLEVIEIDMKGREFTILIERDENRYYVGEVIELPGCFTQARTVEELMKRIREAIALYLEEVGEEEIKYEFVGVQKVIA